MELLLVVLVGCVLLGFGVHPLIKYQQAKWTQTQAVVIRSYPMRAASEGPLFQPHVQYRYSVDGKAYTGAEWAYSDAEDNLDLEKINALLAPYSTGATIGIWFRIADPQQSCIKLNTSYSRSQMWALVCAGLIVIVFAFLIWQITRS